MKEREKITLGGKANGNGRQKERKCFKVLLFVFLKI